MRNLQNYYILIVVLIVSIAVVGCSGVQGTTQPGTGGTATPVTGGTGGTGGTGQVSEPGFVAVRTGQGIIYQLYPKVDNTGFGEGEYYITAIDGPDVVTLPEFYWQGNLNITRISSKGTIVDRAKYTTEENAFMKKEGFGDFVIYDKIYLDTSVNFQKSGDEVADIFHTTLTGFTRAIVYQ